MAGGLDPRLGAARLTRLPCPDRALVAGAAGESPAQSGFSGGRSEVKSRGRGAEHVCMIPRSRALRPLLAFLAVVTSLVSALVSATESAAADAYQALDPRSVRELDIEDLMEIPIRLAERQETSLLKSAAAVTVITAEEIQRSGHTRLPDLLRMVPGLHVARITGNAWAISSRSANVRFSGTMLVLRDGRTLFSPLYGGVYWEQQDLILEDIERIEIIRGPGAALWGANAVSGVINVVTKDARKAEGALLVGHTGIGEAQSGASLRWGGAVEDDLHVKVWGRAFDAPTGQAGAASQGTNDGFVPVGADVNDGSVFVRGGAELHWQRDQESALRVQVEAYDTSLDEQRVSSLPAGLEATDVNASGFHTLFRWQLGGESVDSYVQVYHDRSERTDTSFREERATTDVDAQLGRHWGRHEFTVGAGWRRSDDETGVEGDGIFRLDPASDHEILLSAFVHDRMALVRDRLDLIVGTKVEGVQGYETQMQPTLRVWTAPTESSALWIAATRSVRTPSRAGLDSYLDFNGMGPCTGEVDPDLGCILRTGNPASEPVPILTGEVGLRFSPLAEVLVDVTGFHDDYDQGVASAEIGDWDYAYGIETQVHWRPRVGLRFEMWHAWHRQFLEDSADGRRYEYRQIPRNSAYVHAAWDPARHWTADLLTYYVDAVHTLGDTAIPSYVRVDLGAAWQPDPRWSLAAHVVDLFDDATIEGFESQRLNSARRRGLQLRTVVRF